MEKWVFGKTKSYGLFLLIAVSVSLSLEGQVLHPDSIQLWDGVEYGLRFESNDLKDLTARISFQTETVAAREVIQGFQSWTWKSIRISDNILHPVDIQILHNPSDTGVFYLIFRHGESEQNITEKVSLDNYPELLDWMEEFGFRREDE